MMHCADVRCRVALLLTVLATLLLPGSCVRAETVTLAAAVPRSGYKPPIVGANTHFGTVRVLGYSDPRQVLGQLDTIGAASFRDYMPWQSFDFPSSGPVLAKSGRLMAFLPLATQAGLRPLINLGLANSAVPGGVPPLSDAGLDTFGDYVAKAAQILKPYRPIYEIWNEWNLYIGVGAPQARLRGAGALSDPRAAEHYLPVAQRAVSRIRTADPHAEILVGTVGDDPDWAWAKAIVAGGVLKGASGLSIHLYNQCERDPRKRTAGEMIDRATTLHADLKRIRGGAETAIYVTEFGWPTSRGNCGMPLDVSAYNFAQFVLRASQLPWIKGVWMHELKNISPDPVDRESNYGLFTYDDQAKPAACFMGEAARLVENASSIEVREPVPDVFVARATLGGDQKILLWTTGPWVEARYTTASKPTRGGAMCGETKAHPDASGQFGPAPFVLDFAGQGPVSIDVRT